MKKFAAVAILLAAVGLRAEAQEMKKDADKGFYAIGPKSRIIIQGRAYIDGEVVWANGARQHATAFIDEHALRFVCPNVDAESGVHSG